MSAGEPPERLIFPVGHYLGPRHGGSPEPARWHRVRVGRVAQLLRTEEQFLAWVFAHGVPGQVPRTGWTRTAVIERGRRAGADELCSTVDELVAAGLLAEVEPERLAAVEFTRRYRLRPLLRGLGPRPGVPSQYLLGLPEKPVAAVGPFEYDVWRQGLTAPSLWTVAGVLAERTEAAGSPVGAALAIIGALHPLLAAGVAYLDAADPAP